MKALLENNIMGRSDLATAANVSYPKLYKHLIWLESNAYIEFIIEDGQIAAKLTEAGRDVALKLATLPF